MKPISCFRHSSAILALDLSAMKEIPELTPFGRNFGIRRHASMCGLGRIFSPICFGIACKVHAITHLTSTETYRPRAIHSGRLVIQRRPFESQIVGPWRSEIDGFSFSGNLKDRR